MQTFQFLHSPSFSFLPFILIHLRMRLAFMCVPCRTKSVRHSAEICSARRESINMLSSPKSPTKLATVREEEEVAKKLEIVQVEIKRVVPEETTKLVTVPEENKTKDDARKQTDLLRGVSDSIAAPLQLNKDGLKYLPKQVAISCGGCGFLGTYHFGVMICFQRNAQVSYFS